MIPTRFSWWEVVHGGVTLSDIMKANALMDYEVALANRPPPKEKSG